MYICIHMYTYIYIYTTISTVFLQPLIEYTAGRRPVASLRGSRAGRRAFCVIVWTGVPSVFGTRRRQRAAAAGQPPAPPPFTAAPVRSEYE